MLESKSSVAYRAAGVSRNKQNVKQDEELQPLYLELASSLNVELVYVILKSITQFSYHVGNQKS